MTSASSCQGIQELFYLAPETETVWEKEEEEEVHDSFINALLCALARPQALSDSVKKWGLQQFKLKLEHV